MTTRHFKSFKQASTPQQSRNSARRRLMDRPGVIAVTSGDRTTCWQFSACLKTLQSPPGSIASWLPASGGRLAEARNTVARTATAGGLAWVLFLDDDHVFTPDLAMRLLMHDVEIVAPLYVGRLPPHPPILYTTCPADPGMTDDELRESWATHCRPVPRARGLVEVGHCGTGALLVATDVFRALPEPWFQWGMLSNVLGGGEDTWFTLCARRAGFKVWVDTDHHIGHVTSCAVWPSRRADGTICADLRLATTDLDASPVSMLD